MANKYNRLFNDIEANFIKNNVVGRSASDLTELFNKKFNKNITIRQIIDYKKTNKLRSGIDCRFKKGQIAPNLKKVGDEFYDKGSGYTYIKIGEPRVWIFKSRYLYEKYKGPIPKDYTVIFADGDKQNFELDNLVLVKRKDLLTLKNQNLIFKDKELTKTGIMIAQLINKTAERK